jgi:hypothetical protein
MHTRHSVVGLSQIGYLSSLHSLLQGVVDAKGELCQLLFTLLTGRELGSS